MTTIEINGNRYQVDCQPDDPRLSAFQALCLAHTQAMQNMAEKQAESKPA